MKTVSSDGRTFDLYFTNIKMYNSLPVDYYSIGYDERRGFYLVRQDAFVINDKKIYGVNDRKITKVMNTFSKTNKNLGIILSGLKGMGKSLFAKQLSIKMIDAGYPVIIVDRYYTGLEKFLKQIDQEVMFLFDEFDKTFFDPDNRGGINDPQTYILSVFEGMDVGKKLFVITCNSLDYLSDFIINRPGRFHYHFVFDYPNAENIKEYLNDNLSSEVTDKEEILNSLIKFNRFYPLNYDTLRSIVFEINNGYSINETLEDLNIINNKSTKYFIDITYNMNGSSHTKKCEQAVIDLTKNATVYKSLYDLENEGNYLGTIKFNTTDVKIDQDDNSFYIEGNNVSITESDTDYDINSENTTISKVKFIPNTYSGIDKFSFINNLI